MANEVFKPIEEFTLTSPTGSEQIQISATQKVTLSQIAQLVKSAPLLSSEVTVTNFEAHSYTGRYSFSEIPDNTAFSFKAAASAANGPGVAVYGLAIKISSDTAIYFAGGDSSGAQYCIYGVSGAGTTIKNLLYGEGLTKVDVTDFKALPTILSSVPSGTVVAYRAANTVANGPVSGAGSWGFIFKIDSSTYRVIANIFGGTAAGWGYDLYVGSISGTTTAYWSKINGASEIPDNVKYLSQTYVTEDPTTLWSELESMTNSGSVSAGDFFPFRFNANTVSTPTANAGHGFYQYGTNCAYAIIFEEVASGNGRAWFGHFESNDGAVEWTQIGSSGSSGPTDAITITDFKSPGATAVALKQGQVLTFYAPGGSNWPTGYSSSLFGYVQRDTSNAKTAFWYMAYGNGGNSYAERRLWLGYTDSTIINWTEITNRAPEYLKGQRFDSLNADYINEAFVGLGIDEGGSMVPFYTEASATHTPEAGKLHSGFVILGQTLGTTYPDFTIYVTCSTSNKTYIGHIPAGSNAGAVPTWSEIGASSSGGGMELAGSESSYPINNDSGPVTLSNVNPGDHLLIQAMVVGTGTKTTPQGCFMTGCTVPEAGATELLLLVQDFNSSEDAHFMAGTVSVGNPGIEFELTLLSPSSIASMQIQRMWKLP